MKGKIRVALMVSTIDGRRAKGTAVVARKCVEALLERRDEFDLTFIHYEKSDDPIYRHGVREIIFPRFRWSFLNRRFARFAYYVFSTKDRFDIMQWFQPRLYPLFWLMPTEHIVVTVHGAGDVARGNRFNLMRHVFNWTLILFRRRVAVAIAGSEYARKDIIEHYHFTDAQMRVLHNGAEAAFSRRSPEEIAAVKKKYGLPDAFFLGVGRLIPVKNVLRTLMAFDRFASENPGETISFVHVGAGGSERPAIDAFLAKTRFKDRIVLVEYVEQDDLPALYSGAFALVFPIFNEGFGLPVIEAMACGTPTIISETAAPEMTNDDAILVNAMSEESIANAMKEMLNNPGLRQKLIKNGFACAERYSWKAMQDKLIAIYKELMR